ncbi:hypothetical protein B0O99DRAFT_600990 [Bisporella sp. PMI_857]|nr:hypothetical protein B0O99DRAFT_600990 [Bisporella sp. PMI_857]
MFWSEFRNRRPACGSQNGTVGLEIVREVDNRLRVIEILVDGDGRSAGSFTLEDIPFHYAERVRVVCVYCSGERNGIGGFRDPDGIKPLAYSRRYSQDESVSYMYSSESMTLEAFRNITDVKPVCSELSFSLDVFEYVYLTRPESVIDRIGVYRSRYNIGVALADIMQDYLSIGELEEIDVVIPIAETNYTATNALTSTLQEPYAYAFVKNIYSIRTFIMPEQKLREKTVHRKLNLVNKEF